jgi:hypothetical protein
MATKKELIQQQVAKAVGAGKAVALETVDFNDPNRPKTCLEVDFPILPVNQVAIIEGNAGKPIYQMSKWWARRRSSVFRSMLIAAATKAPDDPSHAAKLVWDNYYANHQKKGAFKHLKVADIFMGGGTTLVEGSRLGMQMVGNDLNPVAWFVVKQELANVDLEQVKKLLADIEAEVKPQIMPYYYCDGPEGEKGTWTHLPTRKVMPADFDPLAIPREERKEYRYEGPEIIYTFWAKHGPCQVTGCGHRTPIMSSSVMAVKTLTVKSWQHTCSKCGGGFHVEEDAARMAPDAPLYAAPDEYPFSVLDRKKGLICPHCGHTAMVNLGKGKNKKVDLTLLVHPQWLGGEAKQDEDGQPYGGSAQDDVAATTRWDTVRAAKIRLLEVRGALPDEVTRQVVFDLFQDLDGFSLDDYKPFSDVSSSLDRLVRFFSAAVTDRQQRLVKVDDATYDLVTAEGTRRARFTLSREAATDQDDLQLMGLDHPLVQDELGRWRSVPPEEVGIAVSGDVDEAVLLSLWIVEASAGKGERRVAVQPIAVKQDGTRVPAVERLCEQYLQAPPATPMFRPEQRSDLFTHAVEPTLQRELKHKGAANGDGSYSAELIGYVEILPCH